MQYARHCIKTWTNSIESLNTVNQYQHVFPKISHRRLSSNNICLGNLFFSTLFVRISFGIYFSKTK